MGPMSPEAPSTPLRLGAVLLAAGSASRMGHRPKALLELEGQPLIVRQLTALGQAGIDEQVVVLGHHAQHLEPLIRDLAVRRVHHPQPEQGQVSSQRLGLRALSDRVDAVIVALVDQPLVGAAELIDLICAYKARPQGTQVVVPTVNKLPGNPVMFSAQVRTAVLAGPEAFGCKQWQTQNPDAVYRWPTHNLRYRQDVDSPEDIAQLFEASGQRLSWPAAWDQHAPGPR